MRGRLELKQLAKDPVLKEMIDSLWREYYGLYKEKYDPENYIDNIIGPDIVSALALGESHQLFGNESVALGYGSTTRSYRETLLGSYPVDLPGTADSWVATDRLFGIGNGTDADNRNDALRMYKSGYSVFDNALRVGAFDWGANMPETGVLQYSLSNGFEGYHNAAWKRFAFIDPAAVDGKLTYFDSLIGQLKTSGVSRTDLETHLSGIPYSAKSVATGTGQILYAFTSDSQGHVIGISLRSLVAADIPALDWSKITTGKPTTLAGYGITDGLRIGLTNSDYNSSTFPAWNKNTALSTLNAPSAGVHWYISGGNNDNLSSLGAQLAVGYSSSVGGYQQAKLYMRSKADATTWNPWIEAYTSNNANLSTINWAANNITAAGTGTFVGVQSEKRGLYSSISNMINTSALFLSNSTYADYGLAIGVNNSHPAIQSMYLNNVYKLAINPFGGRLLIGTNTDNGSDAVQVNGSIQAITAKLTNLTDGYIPYHVSDASGLANSPFYTDGTKVSLGIASTTYRFQWHNTLYGTGFLDFYTTGVSVGSTADLAFYAGGSMRQIIKSSGNTLFKTSADNGVDAIQVGGSALIGGNLTLRSNGETSLMINSISDSPVIRLYKNSVLKWGILAEYPSAGQLTFYDYISGASRMILNSTGISINGSITATSFIKSGGTGLNLLLDDGSVVAKNTYLTSFTETDPTVPAWAKQATKPTYTYSEVGAEAAFSKNTGFNLNLGTTAGTVSEGNHAHSGVYAPVSHIHFSEDLPGTIVYQGNNISLLNNNSGYATQSWVSSNYDYYNYWLLYANGSIKRYVTSGDIVNFIAGSGINITATGGEVTISATAGSMVYPGAGIPVSTGSAWGTSITNNSANWNSAYTFTSGFASNYPDLVAIEALSGTSGFLKKTAVNTWSLDTTDYLAISGGTLTGPLVGTTATFSGNIYAAYGFSNGSSRELKRDIQPMIRSGIDIVNSLRINTYNYRDTGRFGVGFIAEDTDSWLSGIDHKQHIIDNSIGVLFKAVQEEDKQVQELKQRILQLEQKLKDHGIQ